MTYEAFDIASNWDPPHAHARQLKRFLFQLLLSTARPSHCDEFRVTEAGEYI